MRIKENEFNIRLKSIENIKSEKELLDLIRHSDFSVGEDFLVTLKMKHTSIKYDDINTLLIIEEGILLGYICYQIGTIDNDDLYDSEDMKNHMLDNFDCYSNIMKIETFCISEKYRRRKIGTFSLDIMYKIAIELKCVALILTPLPKSISFYNKINFIKYGPNGREFMLKEVKTDN